MSTPSSAEAGAAIREWRARQAEQALERQRAQAETSKLLVTFTLAIGATLVATALQVGDPTALDVWATSVLGVAFLLAIGVVLLDRLKEPNSEYVEATGRALGWTSAQRLAALETLSIAAREDGELVILVLKRTAVLQVFVTLIASGLAAVSLLGL